MHINEFLNKLEGVKGSGGNYSARCPAHDDRMRSLSVKDGEKGIVIHCHAGCSVKTIAHVMNITMSDLFNDVKEGTTTPKRVDIACTLKYELRDISGIPQAVHHRVEFVDGSKTFWWFTPEGNKGLGGRAVVDLPMYLTHQIPAYDINRVIYIVEGEKKADVLAELGIQVLATGCGASSVPSNKVLDVLAGYRIILWPDNDAVGIKHMNTIAQRIGKNCTLMGIVKPAALGLNEKEDCADLIRIMRASGKTDDEIWEFLEKNINEFIGDKISSQKSRSITQIAAMAPTPRAHIIGPIREKDLVEIYAARGLGKTHLGLSLAYALANGERFCMWSCSTPRKVLYIDGEMQCSDIVDRFRIYRHSFSAEPNEQNLRILSNDMMDDMIPSLSSVAGQTIIEDEIFADSSSPVEVLFLDNVSTLFGGAENDGEQWESAHRWLLGLRRKGVAVVFMHHAGKGGGQRGTSRREDILDIVIKLVAHDPQKSGIGNSATVGACFELHFEKSRGVYGKLTEPTLLYLEKSSNGDTHWHSLPLEV